uniref:Uncharacterized protein n=1 Tax=Vannella robusta TaxID=1487602 RepID=A0A7S4IEC6_9EUKA|mmetsp:Transcript_24493/g.31166  ORF Transcript_24493/g.31166 Transcript_24493/m.31166 type:complete len:305 (+) Transcript_24493:18-932(+)
MSWFPSFLSFEEPVRYKVRVKKKPSSATSLNTHSNLPEIECLDSHSTPILSNVNSFTDSEEREPEEALEKFSSIEEELAHYKQLATRQSEEIERLRELPKVQKEIYAQQIKAEQLLRDEAEEKVAILAKQRDTAQLMFSNSEKSLAVLHNQLEKERAILQEELREMRDCFTKQTNHKGQLCLANSETVQETPASLLNRLEQELVGMSKSLAASLCLWEESRNRELKVIRDLCQLIEQADNGKQLDRQMLFQLQDKIESLVFSVPEENEKAWEQEQPQSESFQLSDDTPSKTQSSFTSLLLYGNS